MGEMVEVAIFVAMIVAAVCAFGLVLHWLMEGWLRRNRDGDGLDLIGRADLSRGTSKRAAKSFRHRLDHRAAHPVRRRSLFVNGGYELGWSLGVRV